MNELLAVLIGVASGIAAGIPTSMLMLEVLLRREQQAAGEVWRTEYLEHGCPPVVIIQQEPIALLTGADNHERGR